MDIWEPDSQRPKRSLQDMSHPATLSPSPIHFPGDHAPSNFFTATRYNSAVSNVLPPFFERRRTPHPHNSQSQVASEEMADRSQTQFRPRLETVIDLTDEPEDAPAAEASRAQRPPQLGRSDAVHLGDIGDFIDLTGDGDGDAELMVVGQRRIATPHHRPTRASLRVPPIPPTRQADSPPLFMPVFPPLRHGPMSVIQADGQARAGADVQGPPAMFGRLGARLNAGVLAIVQGHLPQIDRLENGAAMHFWGQIQQQRQGGPLQAMPGFMNYAAAVPNSKPDHVAPPTARDGFTRSPLEDDTIICPSCETELVHDKDVEEPLAKKGGRAPSRKDREEHPFWVVRECGHVYCNSCYQLRSDGKKHAQISFLDTNTSKRKGLQCAVDDCESEVKSKEKWVGVFL